MRYPEGYAWIYPGFPSLAVSYQHTSDFFFSGHVGVTSFLALENHYNRNYFLASVAAISTCFEFMVMIFLRGHYTVDLIFGIAVAHYLWIISGSLAPYIDALIAPEIPPTSDQSLNTKKLNIK